MSRAILKYNLCPEYRDEHGIERREIGIKAVNSEGWLVTLLAAMSINATVNTFYTTLGQSEIVYCLNMSELSTLVIDKNSLTKVLILKEEFKIPLLKNLILLDSNLSEEEKQRIQDASLQYFFLDDLILQGESIPSLVSSSHEANKDSIAATVFTSGTTGYPKGVLLTHRNFLSNFAGL